MRKERLKYAGIIGLGIAVIAIALLFFIDNENNNSSLAIISKAPVVEFVEEDMTGMNCTNTFSESFYSSSYDKSVEGKLKVFTDANDFRQWQQQKWDIKQTQPLTDGSMATKRFNEGYIALAFAPPSLQSYCDYVSVYGIYQSESRDTVIVLSGEHRNSSYQYNKDLATDWKQTVCVIYIKPEFFENLSSLTFAIKPTASESGECGT